MLQDEVCHTARNFAVSSILLLCFGHVYLNMHYGCIYYNSIETCRNLSFFFIQYRTFQIINQILGSETPHSIGSGGAVIVNNTFPRKRETNTKNTIKADTAFSIFGKTVTFT